MAVIAQRDAAAIRRRAAARLRRVLACALVMAELGVGAVPVAAGDRLVGMVTDRDIAVRAVAEGKGRRNDAGELIPASLCPDPSDIDRWQRPSGTRTAQFTGAVCQ